MASFVQSALQRMTAPRPRVGLTPSFEVPGGGAPVAGQGTYRGVGKFKKAGERFTQQLYGEMPERYGRSAAAYGHLTDYLNDPTAAGKMYQGFFDTAARGISDPAMRDFNKEVTGVQASTAARFGGNASSEEGRNIYNTSDLFTRNLTEALARLAPQAAQLGQNLGTQYQTAATGAVSEQDQLARMILEGISANKKKPFDWGALLGQVGGAAAAGLTGGAG